VPQLQAAKTDGSKNRQKVDIILKMEIHARKYKDLPGTKLLPRATICRTEHPRNPILGTS